MKQIQSSLSHMSFKIDVLKSLVLTKLQAWACNFIKKRLQHTGFSVIFAKFLGTPLTEHLRWLLLNKPRRSQWFIWQRVFWSFSISLPWLSNIMSNLLTKSSFDISYYSSWSAQPFHLYCGLWRNHDIMTHFVYMKTQKWLT